MSLSLSQQQANRRKGQRLLRMAAGKLRHPRRRSILFGPAVFENPYQTLLYSAFSSQVLVGNIHKAPRFRKLGLADVYHLHWDEFHMKPSPEAPDKPHYCTPAEDFLHRGGKLVWTMHNALPHGSLDHEKIALFHSGRQFLSVNANLIHVHNDAARDLLVSQYDTDPNKIAVIPHPSYLGWYPEPGSRAKHVINQTLFLAFGTFRNNKGLELILDGFRGLDPAEQNTMLHLAGRGANAAIKKADVTSISSDRLKVSDGFIPDKAVPDLFAAATFCVFGFTELLTSGSLLLPLGFGCIPIAPDLPNVRSALPKALHKFLYAPGDAQSLAVKMNTAASLPHAEIESARIAALDHATALHPNRISAQLEAKINAL